MPAPEADLVADLALMETTVREAGGIARHFFGHACKTWDKSKGNPVTEADIAIDRMLRAKLTAARPDYGWLSEETDDDLSRLERRDVFVIDPIDGTIGFIKAKPQFTICAGLVRDGAAVAGVVYNPITEECFAAAQGGGATLNGKPIHVSRHEHIEGCRMLGPRSMFEHEAWAQPPNTPWPAMTIETRNSVAYRLALVANGAFDATLALSAKRDWDLAAADIIVREAGGCVTAHDGSALRYNRRETIQPTVVCANPALHGALIAKLRDLKLPRA
ncbi:MAG TPA: 3'(2'),5'-bisphosphate nucleotidase CysQ [Rhizomicrobium sp.]|nr:3'(2'),5'-bisphosphate nucleotidase CysQ [Rhizomicrobium sp.]